MQKIKFVTRFLVVCFFIIGLTVHAQQFTVTGGKGSPLLAKDHTQYRFQVWLVYGMGGVTLSYTAKSSTSTHQWYRYKTSASDAEEIPSVQNGSISTIDNVEEGYGYFVEESGIRYCYIWLIDYSKYAFDIQNLFVAENSDPCSGVILDGEMNMPRMLYYMPTGGNSVTLERQFKVTYTTLEWSDEQKLFSRINISDTITGDPTKKALEAPLCDTDILFEGDLFAFHFDVGKKMSIESYEAVAVVAHADTTMVTEVSNNMMSSEDGISAPAEIRFTAYANTPVAALFIWKIYRKDDGPDNPLVRFPGEEIEYTFNQFGEYVVELEVSDRTGKCVDNSNTYTLKIIESALEVPNVFTPGTSPGVNDEFRVAYKSLVRFEGWIFNRWGVEMFHWTNPAQGWDGKKGGKYVAPGVYFYIIEAEGSDGYKWKKKGDVNILRPKTIQDEVQQ